MRKKLIRCGVTVLCLVGCDDLLERDLDVPASGYLEAHQPGVEYEQLFPRYIELCALSQFRTVEGRTGGLPGHGVMYLKGACRDEQAPYPKLRLCDARLGPEEGVGVSVNRWLANVNWIAVPGRDFFFHGDLEPDDRLTRPSFDAAVRKALELELFRGVELLDPPGEEEKPTLEDFVAANSAGTDFGITFGRTVLCARVPVTESMLEQIVIFLNDVNHQYQTGNIQYHWSGYSDNCVHLQHNALAAAGVWEPKSVNAIKLRQLFNLAIPANEFLDLAERATEFPLEHFQKVWDDEVARDALLEFGWLPGHHGALLTSMHVHEANDLYETAFRLFVLELPFQLGGADRAATLFGDARLLDLATNLRWYRSRYQQILAGRPPDEGPSLAGDRERTVRRRYYVYVQAKLQEVEAALARLAGVPSIDPDAPAGGR
jgi:hypothetical protein